MVVGALKQHGKFSSHSFFISRKAEYFLNMNQEDFSKKLEDAYKNAIAQSEAIVANAEIIRKEAEAELYAAREIHTKAEREASIITEQYFKDKQEQFVEAAHNKLLRNLTRQHLESGKNVEEICYWLNLPLSFVEEIQHVIHRKEKSDTGKSKYMENNPALEYVNQGRGGSVLFKNDMTRFSMWWEFGGGDAVAFVNIPTEDAWEDYTRLPLSERKSTLNFVGEQIIRDQLSGKGSFILGENMITFYKSA
jgi:hypothetical protein